MREKTPGQKPQSFYNLILAVTFYHFCCILFVRSELVNPAHTQEKGILQRHEYQEEGTVGAILEAAYHASVLG